MANLPLQLDVMAESRDLRQPVPDDRVPSLSFSIIVNNYNYAAFLDAAIRSALGQTAANVEVIVVDDGSTDASRDVIGAFGSAIVPVFKENGGQASACNAGFRHARGDVVLFLDADDVLHPHCCATIAASGVFEGNASKVNFGLDKIDAVGRNIGGSYMAFPLPAGDFRSSLLDRGFMPTMPMSGNAFARHALERIMPIPEPDYVYAADVAINNGVGLCGPVGAINEVLGSYRVHGRNASAQARGKAINLPGMKRRLDREQATDRLLHATADDLSMHYAAGALIETPAYCQIAMIYARLSGERARRPSFSRFLRSMGDHDIVLVKKAAIAAFMLAVRLAPRAVARQLVTRAIGTGLLFDRLT